MRATVADLDGSRSGHFTFVSSALNVEFLASAFPSTYLQRFARVDVAAKCVMALVATTNYSREDPGRVGPSGEVETYFLGAALASFRDATQREHVDSHATAEAFFALV